MSRKRQFVLAVMLLTMASMFARAGDVIDRIVATVGKRAISQSELEEALRFEMFAAGRPLATVTAEDLKSALGHIVDQELIRNDVGDSTTFAPANEDIEKRLSELREQTPGAKSDEGWRSVLSSYGLDESVVKERVKLQLETMRMVNSRLRPGVRIDQAEVEKLYQSEFLPKLREAGAKEVPLAEVSTRIRQILVERRIGEMLDSWLDTLRAQGTVHMQFEDLRPAGISAAPARITSMPEDNSQLLQ